MIDILRIIITIVSTAVVSNGTETAKMLSFEGEAESPYFTGKTLPGGVDTQKITDGKSLLSARYILEGKDFEGKDCRIFIENNSVAGQKLLKPRIVTDSKALAFLNEDNLVSRLENKDGRLTITISQKMAEVPQCVRTGKCSENSEVSENSENSENSESSELSKQQGTIEEFRYAAKMNGKKLTKRAQVYLPAGYDPADKSKKYNVLYLMHGGGDNTTSFLTPPKDWLRLKDVLDHLIAKGKMEPIIVVTPTFYEDDQHIGNNRMEDAIAETRDFNKELRNYLIPTVEKKYNTHYTGKGKNAVEATRDHRAFGGFSMGALCTWYQLAYDVAAVSRFIPLSGDLWTYDSENKKQPAEVSAKWLADRLAATPYANDFQIFAYTGTKDIAGKPETDHINALYALKSPMFSPANMQFGVKQDGEHFYGHINEYLYHCLPLLWK